MTNVTQVTLTNGVPTAPSGTVSTLDALMALIGEVQASPTSNTALDRLKAILTALNTSVTINPTQIGSMVTGDFTKATPTVPVEFPSDQAPLATKGNTITQAASSTITRPADTTAYTSGDLVANSVTAGSVANLQFTTLARVSGGSGLIVGAKIQKSTNSITNAAFRLHLFATAPTYTSAGDNSAISTVLVASAKSYLGYIDITAMVAFSDVAWGSGAPDNTRGSIPYVATAQIIYGLLEARGAYTPGNAEVFTVVLDALQD